MEERGKLRRLNAFEGEVKDTSPKPEKRRKVTPMKRPASRSVTGSSSVPEGMPKAKAKAKQKKEKCDAEPAGPKATATAEGGPKPKAKAVPVRTESHYGWTAQKFERSTGRIPFWKFTSPDGRNFWTAWEAESNGFKREV